jgi:hypothetical protein
LYDALPLFLVPRQRREGYVLAALTFVVAFLTPVLYPWRAEEGQLLSDHLKQRWLLTFALVYLPVLLLVLRFRPERSRSAKEAELVRPGSGVL